MTKIFCNVFLLSLAACSPSGPAATGNVSLGLPDALTKAAAAGSLEAHLVATDGSETKEAVLTIADGKVSGTLMLAPGTWTIEIQFFEVASSGNLLPIAFIDFGSKEVGGGGLELSYIPTDIRFSESNGVSASLSPTVAPPSGCVSRFDCDGDGFSNFDEIKGGSDPENPKSLPAAPSVSVPPTPAPPSPSVSPPPPTIAVTINDKAVNDGTTMVQGIVKISATATSTSSSSVTLASVEVKGPGLEQGSLLSDGNALPQTFDVSWDTKAVDGGEDQEYTLTFTAQDAEKRVTTLTRKVRIDNVPNIVSFGTPQLIQAGQSADLTWNANNFTSLSIDNGIGDVVNKTKLSVSPITTTTYHLTAIRKGTVKTFTTTQEVTITVNHNPVFNSHTTSALGQDPKSANGVTLSFDRSDADGDTLTSTVTIYKGSACGGSSVLTQTTTTGSANVTGLDPRTDYSYTVSINDGRGGAASGACRSFTTADTGLVGWWRMDEGTLNQIASSASDSSGSGNTATLNPLSGATDGPPIWNDGITGHSVYLADDEFIAPHSGTLGGVGSPHQGFTMGLWFRSINTNLTKNKELMIKGTAYHNFQLWLMNTDDGSPESVVLEIHELNDETRTLLFEKRIVGTTGVVDQNWHHVVGTLDGEGRMSLYIDGVLQGTNFIPTDSDVSNTGTVMIASTPTTGFDDRYNAGSFDDAFLYNRPLSAHEIRQDCSRISGTTCNSLQPVAVNPIQDGTFVPDVNGKFANVEWTTASDATYTWSLYKLPTATSTKSQGTLVAGNQTTSVSSVDLNGTLDYRTSYLLEVSACSLTDSSHCVTSSWNFTTTQYGLVGWWRFDEGSSQMNNCETGNQTTADSSGNNNTGTLFNTPCWRDGVSGTSLGFNEDEPLEDYVQVPDQTSFNFGTGNFTLALWVKFSALSSHGAIGTPDATFVAQDEGGGAHKKWAFSLGGGNLNLHVNDPGQNVSVFLAQAPFQPALNRWYQLGVVREGDRFGIYVDGVLVSTETKSLVIPDVGAPLTIGEAENLGFVDGMIDDVVIYNRALTTQEIRDNCQRNDPSTGSGQVPTCAADDVPDQATPSGNLILSPTRAFIFWKRGTVPSGKTFDHDQLCYATNGSDISGADNCLNSTNRTAPYFVLESLTANNGGYRWKVRTCYTNGSCSNFSPVWSFSTNSPLIAWWKFDEGNGVAASDSSGSGNGGTLNGADGSTHTTGILNNAINLDGVDDYVSNGNIQISQNGPATISGWFYFKARAAERGSNMGLFADLLYQSQVNNLLYIFPTADYFDWRPELNRWYHLVLTYSGDTSTAKLYVDGEVKNAIQQPATHDIPIFYGTVSNNVDGFNGLIDDAAIFNYPLSGAAITNNFCAVEALAGVNPMPAVCQ